MTRILVNSRSAIVASRRVRRRQDDDGAPRSPDPSLRDHRNWQRELALQTPRVSATPACPGGQTGTSHARRSVAREGTARRAWGPPVRYRDKPAPRPVRGPFSMPMRGPHCLPIDNLVQARGEGRLPRLMSTLERTRLLIIDDWGPEPLNAEQRRDLLEIVDDRYDRGSLLITSQLPVNRWHEVIGDPTLADAILDRIIHRAHRIDLKGPSLRRRVIASESSAA